MEGPRLLRHLRLHRRKRMVKPPQAPPVQALLGRKAALKAVDTVAPVEAAEVEAIAAPVEVAVVVTVAVAEEAAIAVAEEDASAVPAGVPAAGHALATATSLDARCVLSA